jgi:hypothetical protein
MLLPYWTNGCVDSMEGLLFESSATTPFHFINQNELSVNPSDAVNGTQEGQTYFQYMGLNVPLGIRHLQMLGVRYFLASSTTVEAAAAADPNLTQVASSGPWSTSYNGDQLDTTWKVYEIRDSALVTPLRDQPVVWTGVKPAQTSWLQPAATWYDTPAEWNVVPSAGGPADWARVPVTDTRPRAVPEPVTTVSRISQTDSSVSFHVDRLGTPVEVRVSYFPNWQAHGAEGPWRVAPNLMVVVPTSDDVTLVYGTTGADRAGDALTLAAAAAAAVLTMVAWRSRRSRRSRRAGSRSPAS